MKRFFKSTYNEADHKAFAASYFSMGMTAAFAVFNGFLGIRKASLWHGGICVYFIVLALLRILIVLSARRPTLREGQKNRICLAAALLLLLLNLCLILPFYMMVTLQKPVNLTLVPAIASAAYTTYKITVASIRLHKVKVMEDEMLRLLRTIDFIDALVSIMTLQNTLIMVQSGGGDRAMLPLTAATSGFVWLVILALSVSMTVWAVRRIKNGE